MSTPREIYVFTDGGCHGNPGPGGWAYIIEGADGRQSASGAEAETTNNRMELEAVIRALEYLLGQGYCRDGVIHVFTDSQYVRNGITGWISRWESNGWRTSAKKPVKNRELWMRLRNAEQRCRVEWHWVRGHSGHPENEEVDGMVQEAIRAAAVSPSS
ncbi:MAG: ribonuclease HI [Spirochaetaceae bacterium]